MRAVGSAPPRDDEPDGPSVGAEFRSSFMTSNGDGVSRSPKVFQVSGRRQAASGALHHAAREWRTDVKVMEQAQEPGRQLSIIGSFVATPDRPELHQVRRAASLTVASVVQS
jgi:hypothetical protein